MNNWERIVMTARIFRGRRTSRIVREQIFPARDPIEQDGVVDEVTAGDLSKSQSYDAGQQNGGYKTAESENQVIYLF